MKNKKSNLAAQSHPAVDKRIGHRCWLSSPTPPNADWDSKERPGTTYQYFNRGAWAFSKLKRKEAKGMVAMAEAGLTFAQPYVYHFSDDTADEFTALLGLSAFRAATTDEWLAATLFQLLEAENERIASLLAGHLLVEDMVTEDEVAQFVDDLLDGPQAEKLKSIWSAMWARQKAFHDAFEKTCDTLIKSYLRSTLGT